MATHSSVLAWRILGTGEPGGLPSLGLHRVGHDWSNAAAAAFPQLGEGNGNTLQYSFLANPMTGEPGGLLSLGSHRVGHNWSDLAAAAFPQLGLPGGSMVKNLPANAGDTSCRFNPWFRKIPWSRKWKPTLVFLPGQSHGQRHLEGYSPWGGKRTGQSLVTKQQQQ